MSIYNMFNEPTFDEWLGRLSKNQVYNIENDKKRIFTKWTPVITNIFEDVNLSNDMMKNICIYAELYSTYESLMSISLQSQSNLKNELSKIYFYIKENNKGKISAIIRKVFNYETGFVEYELEDGNYVRIQENVQPPKMDHTSILPKSFLKLINLQEYRNSQIDEIL